jgi:glycosyltransferase involved in cell wall biosynthesis
MAGSRGPGSLNPIKSSTNSNRVCLVPHYSGLSGPTSFQRKFAWGLEKKGYKISYSLKDRPYSAVLVIGGIKDLNGLRLAKRSGVPIIQRLDGMNWLHRKLPTGIRHFIKAEYGNFMLELIRRRFADRIVYQSRFSKEWWERARGSLPVPDCIIYNGVDLKLFSPEGSSLRPSDHFRILMVEGNLGGGYETGLETAVELVNRLESWVEKPVELVVAGKISSSLVEKWRTKTKKTVHFTGPLDNFQIPELNRSAHLLYSSDLNPACPNSVIEALACGLPVAAFDTGAIPELVTHNAGEIAPYGGDPWKLEKPNLDGLISAAVTIMENQDPYRAAARRRAEKAFDLEKMVSAYLEFMLA